jgi:hypothetical protein
LIFEPGDDVGISELAQTLSELGLEIEAIYRRRASLEELYRQILAEGE